MRRIVYFAGGDNWKFAGIMRQRFSKDDFRPVMADNDPKTLYNALAKAAPVDLLIIGTHGAEADFLLIEGTTENSTECSVSYNSNHGNVYKPDGRHIHPATFGNKILPYLGPKAKISIISCSVAEGESGKTFVMSLAGATGALVYAADNVVRVEVVGKEGAAVKVVGGDVWGSSDGEYPQSVGKRGGRYIYD